MARIARHGRGRPATAPGEEVVVGETSDGERPVAASTIDRPRRRPSWHRTFLESATSRRGHVWASGPPTASRPCSNDRRRRGHLRRPGHRTERSAPQLRLLRPHRRHLGHRRDAASGQLRVLRLPPRSHLAPLRQPHFDLPRSTCPRHRRHDSPSELYPAHGAARHHRAPRPLTPALDFPTASGSASARGDSPVREAAPVTVSQPPAARSENLIAPASGTQRCNDVGRQLEAVGGGLVCFGDNSHGVSGHRTARSDASRIRLGSPHGDLVTSETRPMRSGRGRAQDSAHACWRSRQPRYALRHPCLFSWGILSMAKDGAFGPPRRLRLRRLELTPMETPTELTEENSAPCSESDIGPSPTHLGASGLHSRRTTRASTG